MTKKKYWITRSVDEYEIFDFKPASVDFDYIEGPLTLVEAKEELSIMIDTQIRWLKQQLKDIKKKREKTS
jgi:hypothetical protein